MNAESGSGRIAHVRRAIQMAPDCTTKEVTKAQAIQAVLSDIKEMQSKGYDWRAIASLDDALARRSAFVPEKDTDDL